MADGYTEADVELVAKALWSTLKLDFPNLSGTPTKECYEDARAVLDALVEAGRLLPEGASYEERLSVQLTDEKGGIGRDAARDMEHAQVLARRRKAWGWGVEIQRQQQWWTEWEPVGTQEVKS